MHPSSLICQSRQGYRCLKRPLQVLPPWTCSWFSLSVVAWLFRYSNSQVFVRNACQRRLRPKIPWPCQPSASVSPPCLLFLLLLPTLDWWESTACKLGWFPPGGNWSRDWSRVSLRIDSKTITASLMTSLIFKVPYWLWDWKHSARTNIPVSFLLISWLLKVINWTPVVMVYVTWDKRVYVSITGRTAPLLKPPQNPHCWAREDDHAENPPTLATLPNSVLFRLSGHSDPILFSKPFDVTLW